MVLVEIHHAVLRVNQSKVRRDHDLRGMTWQFLLNPTMDRKAHRRVRHSTRLEIRSSMVLSLDTAMNMRSVIVLSHQGRAISLRSRLTLQRSLRVLVIQVSSGVNLLCLVNGLPRRFNLQLLLLGR